MFALLGFMGNRSGHYMYRLAPQKPCPHYRCVALQGNSRITGLPDVMIFMKMFLGWDEFPLNAISLPNVRRFVRPLPAVPR
jgi:hypothetical protein